MELFFQFGEVAPSLLDDYSVPYLFQEDLFDVLDPDKRPSFRWLILGPERSGASWHVDPALTSAWNTLLVGRKRSNFVNKTNFEFVCLDMAPGHCHKGVCRAGFLAVYLVSGYVIKLFAEGGLNSSIHSLGTEVSLVALFCYYATLL
ncbi:hypothetical protein B296_00045256 [Ensete ventricosum]|uniref:JmjC domain-containing protein n=1 Tax=Ensete ventricosum TaxID=4639 RepID=A0A426YPC3_ENSVE|nr:hypothetical protein B296_00045256 [Ensete ventricosum]